MKLLFSDRYELIEAEDGEVLLDPLLPSPYETVYVFGTSTPQHHLWKIFYELVRLFRIEELAAWLSRQRWVQWIDRHI